MSSRTKAWSREEVEATVADYFHMLTMELTGQAYNKTEHRRNLMGLLNDRSDAAIERKHQNVSAVLIELGCPFISGYKPLGNYQALLGEIAADRVSRSDTFDKAALAAVQLSATAPSRNDFSGAEVDAPRSSYRVEEPTKAISDWRSKHSDVRRDYLDREARNASLGAAGEAFVIAYERWRLTTNGKEKLAGKVEHVSKTRGDGLGFDVLSFEVSGKERLIEVKTTSFGKETPFFVTGNEVARSRADSDLFHLFRLFEFRRRPRLFSLHGAIDQHCRLDPVTYQAHFN